MRPVYEEVGVHSHVVERIKEGIEDVARAKFEQDASSSKKGTEVRHEHSTTDKAGVEFLVLALVFFIIDEHRVLRRGRRLSLNKLVEKVVCIAHVEQEECVIYIETKFSCGSELTHRFYRVLAVGVLLLELLKRASIPEVELLIEIVEDFAGCLFAILTLSQQSEVEDLV